MHGQFPQKDSARLFQPGRGGCVHSGNSVNIHLGAGRGEHTGSVIKVLKCEGDAVKIPLVVSTHDLGLGNPGIRQGLVLQNRYEGVELAVGIMDPLQESTGKLHW